MSALKEEKLLVFAEICLSKMVARGGAAVPVQTWRSNEALPGGVAVPVQTWQTWRANAAHSAFGRFQAIHSPGPFIRQDVNQPVRPSSNVSDPPQTAFQQALLADDPPVFYFEAND